MGLDEQLLGRLEDACLGSDARDLIEDFLGGSGGIDPRDCWIVSCGPVILGVLMAELEIWNFET